MAEEMTAEQYEAHARSLLAKDIVLEVATNRLEECLTQFDAMQEEFLPKQMKGIIIPNMEERIQGVQGSLAVAIDNIITAMAASKHPEAVEIAARIHSIGVQYFQGVIFGIQYAEMMTAHSGDRTFQRMLDRSYKMLARIQTQGPKKSRLAL